MNIEKQIEYWVNTAHNDLETAELLIKNKRILHGLFFCHLTLEKLLKAHVIKQSKNEPPRIHDLLILLNRTTLKLNIDDQEFLGLMMKYLLEGRYPEYYPALPGMVKANEYLNRTKELFECLKKKL